MSYANWMRDNWATLGSLNVKQICLPGAHDAGMSVARNCTKFGSACNTQTQTLGMSELLRVGVRYFDLRPTLFGASFVTGHYQDTGIWLVGNQGCNGEGLTAILDAVAAFIDGGARELIVLKFSHFYNRDADRSFNNADFQALFQLVNDRLGNRLFVNNTGRRLAQLSLAELMPTRGTVWAVFDLKITSGSLPAGMYTYADYDPTKPNPTVADLVVYDEYSETNTLATMTGDQLSKLADKANHGGDMFLLSWTLTLSKTQATTGSECILPLSGPANDALAPDLHDAYFACALDRERIPNVLYVDTAADFVTEIGVTLNNLLYPAITSPVSQDKPLSGQKNRSSEDFRFPFAPDGPLLVHLPPGVFCLVMHDRGLANDVIEYILYDGVQIPQDKLKGSVDYYLASPQGASGAFRALFTTSKTASSEPKPKKGEKNRSGSNWKLNGTPRTQVQVSMPAGVYCLIMEDRTKDVIRHVIYNGAVIPCGVLKGGTNYYLASPQGASANFEVTFTFVL